MCTLPWGVTVVSSQSIFELHPTAVRTAIASSSRARYVAGSVVSICNSPAYMRTVEEGPASNRDGLGCARGIRVAFLLEGGMALLIYGIWHLWHLVR
jgi:hypothetical protein